MASLVESWLDEIGLSHVFSNFEAAGIVTPSAIAELELAYYGALGVKEPNDRKQLFYLVQKIKMELEKNENMFKDSDPGSVEKSGIAVSEDASDAEYAGEADDGDLSDDEIEPVRKVKGKSTIEPSQIQDLSTVNFDDLGRRRSTRIMKKRQSASTSGAVSFNPSAQQPNQRTLSSKDTRERREVARGRVRSASRDSIPRSRSDDQNDENDDAYNETMENDNEISDWGYGDQWSAAEPVSSGLSNAEDNPHKTKTGRRLADKRQRKSMGAIMGRKHSMNDISEDDSIGDRRRHRSSSYMMRSRSRDVSPSSESSAQDRRKRVSAPITRSNPAPGVTTRRRRTGVPSGRRESIESASDVSLSYGADEEGSVKRSASYPKVHSNEAQKSENLKARRFESKLPNPAARTRLGKKGLSTIPAESVAPMSPLVVMSSTQLDESVRSHQHKQHKQDTVQRKSESRTKNSRSRLSFSSIDSGFQSGSDTEPVDGHQRLRSNDTKDRPSTSKHTGKPKNRPELVPRAASFNDRSLTRREHSFRGSLARSQSSKSPIRSRSASSRTLDKSRSAKTLTKEESSRTAPVFVHGAQEDDSWASQIACLREDNEEEHGMFVGASEEQFAASGEMRIRVLVRKRPMSEQESSSREEIDVVHPLDHKDYGRLLVYQPKSRVDLTKEVETVPFAFDNVFDENASNDDIYKRAVRNIIPGVFEGRWASVVAYGQTGSGKTFTMMGSGLTGGNSDSLVNPDEVANRGLYYLAAQDIFKLAKRHVHSHLTFGISLFEIYGGKLFDLLNGRNPVKCLEDRKGKVCFPGLSEHPVRSAREVMEIIEEGSGNRSTGTTSANADSSRSHAVLQISLRKQLGKKRNIEHGRLSFIDLAGSERGADTAQASRTTRLEGAEINTSLLALKEVIRALATGDSMAHIPFRSSKLTQVLKESFVGKNTRCVMVACVAPNMKNCEHTLNTLRYADRVKERDAETGALSSRTANGTISQHSKTSSIDSFLDNGDDVVGDAASSRDDADCAEEDVVDEYYNEEKVPDEDVDDEYASDAAGQQDGDVAGDILAEILESPDLTPAPNVIEDQRRRLQSSSQSLSDGSSKDDDNNYAKKESAKALATTHRAVMADMLSMVKHEMSIVNTADANRDAMEDYLEEMGKLQEKKLDMIATLRKSLSAYYAARGDSSDKVQEHPRKISTTRESRIKIVDSDDDIEDLRY